MKTEGVCFLTLGGLSMLLPREEAKRDGEKWFAWPFYIVPGR